MAYTKQNGEGINPRQMGDEEILAVGGELLRAAFTSEASATSLGDELLDEAFGLVKRTP